MNIISDLLMTIVQLFSTVLHYFHPKRNLIQC